MIGLEREPRDSHLRARHGLAEETKVVLRLRHLRVAVLTHIGVFPLCLAVAAQAVPRGLAWDLMRFSFILAVSLRASPPCLRCRACSGRACPSSPASSMTFSVDTGYVSGRSLGRFICLVFVFVLFSLWKKG